MTPMIILYTDKVLGFIQIPVNLPEVFSACNHFSYFLALFQSKLNTVDNFCTSLIHALFQSQHSLLKLITQHKTSFLHQT